MSNAAILPRWLKLTEAALYSAIGQKRLMALAEAGTIRGFRDPDNGRHDWIFDRLSIDSYREGQGEEMDPGKSARIAKELWAVHQERERKKATNGK